MHNLNTPGLRFLQLRTRSLHLRPLTTPERRIQYP